MRIKHLKLLKAQPVGAEIFIPTRPIGMRNLPYDSEAALQVRNDRASQPVCLQCCPFSGSRSPQLLPSYPDALHCVKKNKHINPTNPTIRTRETPAEQIV